MGSALAAAAAGPPLVVEREDGHLSTADLRWWLGLPGARAPRDIGALDLIRCEPVLDVGCATGRHTAELCRRGIDAMGIDTCAVAVNMARANGLPAVVEDAWRYQPSQYYSTVVALGGNLGIAGRAADLVSFLRRIASLLRPGGDAIVTSVDWRVTAADHRAFIECQRGRGRYPGDTRLRLQHGTTASEWFDWLLADHDLLVTAARSSGFDVGATRWFEAHYAARLTLLEGFAPDADSEQTSPTL